MADDQYDWQLLNDIFYKFGRLDHPLYQPLAHDNYPSQYRLLALESAFRSRTIRMRGCRVTALGLAPHQRIETKIDAETAIDIPLDEVTLRNRYGGSEPTEIAVFKRVQADMASVEQWLPENILRADHVVDEPKAADDVEAGVGGQLVFIESAPEASAPKPRARPQREKAKRHLQNMFPNGIPPKDKLPLRALLAKCKGPEWDGLKRDSIGRAAKELREAAQK
jgi:hypothetical protein